VAFPLTSQQICRQKLSIFGGEEVVFWTSNVLVGAKLAFSCNLLDYYDYYLPKNILTEASKYAQLGYQVFITLVFLLQRYFTENFDSETV
jgi:hypothetical protein